MVPYQCLELGRGEIMMSLGGNLILFVNIPNSAKNVHTKTKPKTPFSKTDITLKKFVKYLETFLRLPLERLFSLNFKKEK